MGARVGRRGGRGAVGVGDEKGGGKWGRWGRRKGRGEEGRVEGMAP